MICRASIAIFASLASLLLYASDVETTLSSKKTSGEPLKLVITVKDAGDVQLVEVPQSNPNWRVEGPYESQSREYVYSGGETKQSSTHVLSFVFHPLKKGNFEVPVARVNVDSKIYTSPKSVIQVTGIGNKNPPGQIPRRGPLVPGFPLFPLEEFFSDARPMPGQARPTKLDIFVDAEPNKTKVYVGELINIPFYIYANQNVFRNLEFASFPTFKDFIKEELYLPKNWRTERVNYRNQPYLRSEITRFALFPLKEGTLYVDPLKMRIVELDEDLYESLTGKAPDGQPIMKASGTIPIEVLPLPPNPAFVTQSEVPVGTYAIGMRTPDEELSQNQPFSIKVKIEGKGNIKGIPEPELKLPATLQRSKVSSRYEFREDASGFKEFDYLLVPRSAGDITVAENAWTYFDPDKKQYETLKMPSIELHIAASNRQAPVLAEVSDQKIVFSGNQDFTPLKSEVPLWPWSFPLLSFVGAGFIFVDRKRYESEMGLKKNQPWALVERKIRALKSNQSAEALQYIEEWILTRFRPISTHVASFSDLTASLRETTQGSLTAKIDKMEKTFRALEASRFGGSAKDQSVEFSFDEIKKLSEEIVQGVQSSDSKSSDSFG